MAAVAAASEGTWLGHPKGLFVLFMTEMWERFSYYGMRSLLVLYMVNHLFIQPDVGQRVLGFTALKSALEGVFGPLGNQALSSQIYGLYTGLVYFTPFFGGLLADRILGQRKTVVIGGLLMALGHFLMAIESMFFPALMFLILGNGCFKPNISTQVGLLYPQGDPRRDGAFSIFYVGINLGAFLAPLVCGTLGQKVGWHYGFAAAGVGMLIGLVVYLMNQKHLATDVLEQTRIDAAAAKQAGTETTKAKLTQEEWLRIGAIVVACIIVASFWAVYEQQGNVMQLWADRNTNWKFFGWTMPSTWYQSFNPFMIFLFTPLLTSLWAMQSAKGKEPSSLTKMAMGCVLLGLGFVVMIVASTGMSPDAKRSVFWLVGSTLIFTFGELYLSPIGLSFVTKVAPAAIVSMMMGVWFLANFIGNYMSGYLGTYWEKIPHSQFFMLMTGIALTAGLVLFIIGRPLNKIVSGHDKLR
ncbi:MAG: peptide MFS transporter [Candidatus Eisenbacteria bacterium]